MSQATASPPRAPEAGRPPRPAAAKAARGRRWRWRKRTPTVIQMEAVECGAASLAMILGYYGKFVPLEELRAACGVSRDGAKASSVINAARRYGLIARGFQMEAQDLRTAAKPVIIFWAFQHFLVVEGVRTRFGKEMVAVNDPASGPRLVDWEDFDSGFTGVVLTFEPSPDFRPGGRPTRVGQALLARRMPSGRALPLVLLASLLLVVPGIIGPAFSRVYIDRILSGRDPGYLVPLLFGMGLTSVAVFVLTSVQRHYLLRLEIRLGLVSSARFFRHLLRLPVEFFLQRRPAEVAKRVQANDTVAEILSRDLAVTAVNLVLVLFYAAILIRYDLLLGLVGVAMALLNILVLRRVSRSRTDAVAALRADLGNLTSTTFNTLQLIETVKASGAEPNAFQRWAGFLAKAVTAKQRLGVATATLTVVPPLLAGVNSGLILLIGGLRVVDGVISVGMLVAFQTLLNALSRPVTQLTNLGGQLQDISADINRLYDVERYPVAHVFEPRPAPPVDVRLDGSLEFDDVSFGYNPIAPPVIKNLSFSVVPGRRVAIVGNSGSGKSTVGKLAAGLYVPGSGQVLLDGLPREAYSRTAVAVSVAYVDQDISLFEGTVRDNLTLWSDDIPDEVVIAALRDAAIFDMITARPGGLNSNVREGGRNFSGGQRQRLELARALSVQPTLLVLDEATSALDSETERIIADNLRRRGCGCLIIAHRLSTIRDADEILVLDQGEVVEQGRHEELVAKGGHYARLIENAHRNGDGS
ncbi:NHLP family bacteriocin export ABC transporter peptidase/permease/ATPase subunit [Sphaerisporangium corydalis]|uniref:NHLP family bacteriocin export ABC transporter peptidase/permease/ATPase subunit n=1 Tax=Sphaerisporangium corydalis TaxID=1441875 RepID=A0ABV9ELQ1_9ACTN|nr:NHLP family bacteriocin export ABC transporter peptidase/permease/ATPase subunit [Sphaerisporangium corydalis]